MSFIHPVQTNIYNIFDPKDLAFLTRLRLGVSHLNEHRFRHNFQDCLNPLCSCSLEIEDTSYYILHCHCTYFCTHFSHHFVDLMISVKSICDNFDSMPDNVKEDLLVYGDSRFDENKNRVILKATINYIKLLKDSLDPFLINVSLLINVQLLTYNSDHSLFKIFRVSYC